MSLGGEAKTRGNRPVSKILGKKIWKKESEILEAL